YPSGPGGQKLPPTGRIYESNDFYPLSESNVLQTGWVHICRRYSNAGAVAEEQLPRTASPTKEEYCSDLQCAESPTKEDSWSDLPHAAPASFGTGLDVLRLGVLPAQTYAL
ncbi:hypothetical protein, partial [Simiduia curdlanivorans]